MQAARLEITARLRAETRAVLADLRRYGCPASRLHHKSLYELWELRDAYLRRLMKPPGGTAA